MLKFIDRLLSTTMAEKAGHDNMAQRRQEMVETMMLFGITNQDVLDAFRKVERHLFLEPDSRDVAYDDCAYPIGSSQTISQPYTVAYMTSLLYERRPEGKVLEIGTGSGYQAAILDALGYRVFTIERIEELYLRSGKVFDELGLPVARKLGDGTLGWEEEAPFDGIIVTAASPGEPKRLMSQLAEGGCLVVPVGGLASQQMTVIQREKGRFHKEVFLEFAFVPLIGAEGWKDLNQ
jgi:protein-L-isoaspartate(D-aspartate) O-methyltransferase